MKYDLLNTFIEKQCKDPDAEIVKLARQFAELGFDEIESDDVIIKTEEEKPETPSSDSEKKQEQTDKNKEKKRVRIVVEKKTPRKVKLINLLRERWQRKRQQLER